MAETSRIAEFARTVAPGLHIASDSNPEPVLREHNVVALVPTTEEARAAVLALEALDDDDSAVGVVVMGSGAADDTPAVDPEGVTRAVAGRAIVGGIIGAVVGAVVVGVLTAVVFDGPGLLGAVLGGPLLIGPIVAIWVVFRRLGGSDAYRQTFTEPQRTDVSLVSYHTDDAGQADVAFSRLRDLGPRKLLITDRSGTQVLRDAHDSQRGDGRGR
jgi:hypothetical protein